MKRAEFDHDKTKPLAELFIVDCFIVVALGWRNLR